MEIKIKKIKIRDLYNNYLSNEADNSIVAYYGRLNVRPPFQREYIYKEEQRDEVIRTIFKGFPLNIMYWSYSGNNEEGEELYELMDGQQRTISICNYINNDFSVKFDKSTNNVYLFNNLSKEEQNKILDYELDIYICKGSENERLEWFKVINIAGIALSDQELRNAIYVGSWIVDAKYKFSKSGCIGEKLGKDYFKGERNRQDYLEQVLLWISSKNDMTIEEYMSLHQHDQNADELLQYFKSVINWINIVFPSNNSKPRKEMKGIKWGILYNKYNDKIKTSLANEVNKLMENEEIQNKKGIYEYLLTGEEKYLNLRTFDESDRRTVYEKQKGKCVLCKKEFKFEEMHSDHIIPWSKGGKTTLDNCQMLCIQCNIKKSNK